MATLRGFANRMRVVATAVPNRADVLVRQVTLAVAATVVKRTPVDTGRAKGNWQANLGAPAAGALPKPPGGPAQAVNRAMERANEVAAAYRGGVDVHITNNLPYIQRLNEGSSDQAPAGFVEAAAASAVRKIQSTRIIR